MAKNQTQRSRWTRNSTSQPFAKGKHARAICDRSGFEYPMSEMVVEAGTNYLVHRSEDDGMWNLIDHPQNYPPTKLGDAIAIENPRVDRQFENFFTESDGDILQLSDPNNPNLEMSD